MAVTNTTTMAQVINKLIGVDMMATAKNEAVLRGLAYEKQIPRGAGLTATIPMASAFTAQSVTEATATTAQAFTPTDAEVTLAQKEIYVLQSKLVQYATGGIYDPSMLQEATETLVDAIDASLAALLDGFVSNSNEVGSTGVNLVTSVLDTAIAVLSVNAKRHASMSAFVLHPQHLLDLRAEASGVSTGLSPIFSRPDLIGYLRVDGNVGDGLMRALRGSYMGVPVFETPACPLTNSDADRAGALLCVGKAIALGIGWEPEIESASAAAAGISGQVHIANVAYGVTEINDLYGVSILGDA